MAASRATRKRLLSLMWQGNLRARLCAPTVPRARMAPSAVDIEAATMAIRAQAPMNGGASWVSSLMTAAESGTHAAHRGKSRMAEHESTSNSAYGESGPVETRQRMA
eukprot:scaffold647805_cov41-Prasinocladus_malaysianus.AAC.1